MNNEIIKGMDEAAIEAQNDFMEMVDQEALEKSRVVEWWNKWYLKVGHKRLGRILIKGL